MRFAAAAMFSFARNAANVSERLPKGFQKVSKRFSFGSEVIIEFDPRSLRSLDLLGAEVRRSLDIRMTHLCAKLGQLANSLPDPSGSLVVL